MRSFDTALPFLVSLVTFGLSLGVALGLPNRVHHVFDAFAQFRLHFVVLLFLAVVIAASLGLFLPALTGLVVIVAALAMTAPYLPGFGPASTAASSDRTLTVATFNMRYDNAQTDLAARVVTSASPDVVIMQEVKGTPNALLDALKGTYPHQLRCSDGKVGGATVVSRLPLAGAGSKHCHDTPYLAAITVKAGDRDVTIASFHGAWPWPFEQHDRIADLDGPLSSLPHPLVLAGDFNAAPWTQGVQSVARATRTTVTPGVRLSWLSARLPRSLKTIGLPLDHLMVSDGVTVLSARRLPYAGSDHLPILFELALE